MTDGQPTKEVFGFAFTFYVRDPERTRSEWERMKADLTRFLECRGWSPSKAQKIAQKEMKDLIAEWGYLGTGPKDVSGWLDLSFDWEELAYLTRSQPEPITGEPVTTSGQISPRQRPPSYAEYVLYLLVPKEEREAIIGDLQEGFELLLKRFDKRLADIWYCKQVAGSVLPLLRRALLRIGALVWLGRILRRLIS